MSNVIAFRRPVKPSFRHRVAVEDALDVLAANNMTVSSTILLEGLGDLDEAISRAVKMLRAMPNGKARDLAQAELDHIRDQLQLARRASVHPDVDPAA